MTEYWRVDDRHRCHIWQQQMPEPPSDRVVRWLSCSKCGMQIASYAITEEEFNERRRERGR